MGAEASRIPSNRDGHATELHELYHTNTCQSQQHMGPALERMSATLSRVGRDGQDNIELEVALSLSRNPAAAEADCTSPQRMQGVPPELGSLISEMAFIGVCSVNLMIYSFLLGDVTVNQAEFQKALDMSNSELPWLVGSYSTANGLALVISGSLMDLAPPKTLMVGSFAWLMIWHVVGVFSITPGTLVLFFIVRAMQGLAVGVLISGSMSVMGRVYKPGIR